MSKIYFHSQHGEAAVSGSERAYASVLCTDLAGSAAGIPSFIPSPLLKIVPNSHWAKDNKSLRSALGGSEPLFLVNGQPVNTFGMVLNTAFRMGNDTIKLLARLHGQCEGHCWVASKNRLWLANMIEQGRELKILRPDMGWESVVALLRSGKGPVVTSFSVCEQFPNSAIAAWTPPTVDGEKDWDAWYDLPDAQRWSLAMKGLRKQYGMELTPDNWNEFYFDDGHSVFDLLEYASQKEKSNEE